MPAKPTVSIPDELHAFAMGLVERGLFPSLSAVVQHGLRLAQRDEELHFARLEAIRTDLERRARGSFLDLDVLNQRFESRWSTEDRAEAEQPGDRG